MEAAVNSNDVLGAGLCVGDAENYELRFRSLFRPGRGFAFPCDARGCVDLNTLGDRARINYLYARAMVGRELAEPMVRQMQPEAVSG